MSKYGPQKPQKPQIEPNGRDLKTQRSTYTPSTHRENRGATLPKHFAFHKLNINHRLRLLVARVLYTICALQEAHCCIGTCGRSTHAANVIWEYLNWKTSARYTPISPCLSLYICVFLRQVRHIHTHTYHSIGTRISGDPTVDAAASSCVRRSHSHPDRYRERASCNSIARADFGQENRESAKATRL